MDTQERDKVLADKERWIQEILTEWARNIDILGIGERIVFSMRIEQTPLVTSEEEPGRVLEMSIEQFFTHTRLMGRGAKKTMASRIVNAILRVFEGERKGTRMHEFLKRYPTPRGLRKINNLGEGGVKLVIAAIQHAGLSFND